MKNQTQFAIGDIVKLKSGGPDMTVRTSPGLGDKTYYCQWFAGKKLESGSFPTESLERVVREAK